MKSWKRIEPTIVSKIGWRTVVSKTFQLPSGKVHNFETISAEGSLAAGCIALTEDNQVIVACQFRPGPEKMMADIPGGNVDAGEAPEDAVRRELLEETGYQAGHIEPLGVYLGNAYANMNWHYFLATGCKLSGVQQLEPTEFAEVRLISIEELIQNAMASDMTDPVAVLFAYEKLRALQAQHKEESHA